MKYIRRLLWFFASKMMLFSLFAALFILAFYLAMNAANVFILLSDGMKERTHVIMTREDPDYLNEFFRKEFLDTDEQLHEALSPEAIYTNYRISGFESHLSLEWVWSWPWEDVAKATVVYQVPEIRGTILSSKSSLAKSGKIPSLPPPWQGGRYEVELYRVNGQWKIAQMEQTQIIRVETDPTPAPTLSPTAAP